MEDPRSLTGDLVKNLIDGRDTLEKAWG